MSRCAGRAAAASLRDALPTNIAAVFGKFRDEFAATPIKKTPCAIARGFSLSRQKKAHSQCTGNKRTHPGKTSPGKQNPLRLTLEGIHRLERHGSSDAIQLAVKAEPDANTMPAGSNIPFLSALCAGLRRTDRSTDRRHAVRPFRGSFEPQGGRSSASLTLSLPLAGLSGGAASQSGERSERL